MIRQPPPKTSPARTARRRKAVRRTLGPAAAPTRPRPDEATPIPPVATADLEPLDEEDLRALRSGWTFVE
ncbi:hypothetical protein DA075_20955 [Methylobacterium currus]|uniref:Uncharacterized protein n=1 Tax=Methylobacterium currus TaxID=2051553 RepID=A0A2R4WNE5_9HYPH|nr:hypothetical protein [Methylobacterium currus]AWB23066.1 hypothetical protein DA075_20955 [Methylobacterium currus]